MDNYAEYTKLAETFIEDIKNEININNIKYKHEVDDYTCRIVILKPKTFRATISCYNYKDKKFYLRVGLRNEYGGYKYNKLDGLYTQNELIDKLKEYVKLPEVKKTKTRDNPEELIHNIIMRAFTRGPTDDENWACRFKVDLLAKSYDEETHVSHYYNSNYIFRQNQVSSYLLTHKGIVSNEVTFDIASPSFDPDKFIEELIAIHTQYITYLDEMDKLYKEHNKISTDHASKFEDSLSFDNIVKVSGA